MLEKPLQFIEKHNIDEDLYRFEPKEKTDLPANLEDLWTENPYMLPEPWNNITNVLQNRNYI